MQVKVVSKLILKCFRNFIYVAMISPIALSCIPIISSSNSDDSNTASFHIAKPAELANATGQVYAQTDSPSAPFLLVATDQSNVTTSPNAAAGSLMFTVPAAHKMLFRLQFLDTQGNLVATSNSADLKISAQTQTPNQNPKCVDTDFTKAIFTAAGGNQILNMAVCMQNGAVVNVPIPQDFKPGTKPLLGPQNNSGGANANLAVQVAINPGDPSSAISASLESIVAYIASFSVPIPLSSTDASADPTNLKPPKMTQPAPLVTSLLTSAIAPAGGPGTECLLMLQAIDIIQISDPTKQDWNSAGMLSPTSDPFPPGIRLSIARQITAVYQSKNCK